MAETARLLIAVALIVAAGCAHAPAPAPPAPAAQATEMPRLIGPVKVYVQARAIELPAEVCLREGILDYIAIAPECGKEYESAFVAHCQPHELHAGLLAIGARPGSIDPAFRGDGRGDPLDRRVAALLEGRPRGARVRIRVRRGEEGAFGPVEGWLIDRSTGKTPEPLAWVFTGSWFDPQKRYAADVYQTVAAVWYDGTAPLNLARRVGSPYRGDALGYEINTKAIPEMRAPVTLRLELIDDAK